MTFYLYTRSQVLFHSLSLSSLNAISRITQKNFFAVLLPLFFLHYSNKLFILLLSEIIVAVYWFCGPESNFSSHDDDGKKFKLNSHGRRKKKRQKYERMGILFHDILFDAIFAPMTSKCLLKVEKIFKEIFNKKIITFYPTPILPKK